MHKFYEVQNLESTHQCRSLHRNNLTFHDLATYCLRNKLTDSKCMQLRESLELEKKISYFSLDLLEKEKNSDIKCYFLFLDQGRKKEARVEGVLGLQGR